MRVATFNLLHGRPVPDVDDARPAGAEVLAHAAAALDADVVALQEADVDQPRSGSAHQVAIVAEALGAAHWRFAPALRGTPGPRGVWTPLGPGDLLAGGDAGGNAGCGPTGGPAYGVGLVSRLPVVAWRATVFPAPPVTLPLLVAGPSGSRWRPVRDEPRVALAAVLRTPRGPLSIVAAHLSFVPGVNVRQLRALRRWAAGLPRPLLLCGDLNLPGRVPARVTGWTPLATAATYPTYRPRVQLDHVLADGLPDDVAAAARGRAVPLGVSDHAALVVDLPW